MNPIKSIWFQEKSHDFDINYSYGIEIKIEGTGEDKYFIIFILNHPVLFLFLHGFYFSMSLTILGLYTTFQYAFCYSDKHQDQRQLEEDRVYLPYSL